MLMYRK